jgi:hypothetical protein
MSQELHLARAELHSLVKAKLNPQTFTAIDLANKANIKKQGSRVAQQVFEIDSADGEKGKGISTSAMNERAQLNNDTKV